MRKRWYWMCWKLPASQSRRRFQNRSVLASSQWASGPQREEAQRGAAEQRGGEQAEARAVADGGGHQCCVHWPRLAMRSMSLRGACNQP
jgi:hypothetical protein